MSGSDIGDAAKNLVILKDMFVVVVVVVIPAS